MDNAKQLAEEIHKRVMTGLFPMLKLAMNRYADDPTDANWYKLAKVLPKDLLPLFLEKPLPPPDGYDIHNQPIWNSQTLCKHLGVSHTEIEAMMEESGTIDECLAVQIAGRLN